MKSGENKLRGKELLAPLILSVLLILPGIFLENGPRVWYIILAGLAGWSLGKELVLHLRKKEKQNRVSPFLSNTAISIYVILYLLISAVVDSDWLNKNLLLFFLTKNILGCFWFFYGGIKGIQTKQMWLRGYPLTKKGAMVYGTLAIIAGLIILFARPIISVFYG